MKNEGNGVGALLSTGPRFSPVLNRLVHEKKKTKKKQKAEVRVAQERVSLARRF